MHLLCGWLSLSTLVCSAWAKGPTPPPYVKPEAGPPKDKFNCRLNVRSVVPWMVAVWDAADEIVVGHGSILTYIAFITTCRQYKKTAPEYRAHGQFIWNVSKPFEPCMQQTEIEVIIKHPNCSDNLPNWLFYDFAIFKMKKAFDITGVGYPTIGLSNSENTLLEDVRYLNLVYATNTTGCFLPCFRSQEEKIPIFNFNSQMQVIPFKEECMKLLCEKQPADPSYTAMCKKQFSGTDLDTFLCMKNKSDADIQLGRGNSYWLAGAPLYCNGSAYGMVSQPMIRKGFSTKPTDFHYIVAFFRVWNWIVENISKYSVPWVKDVYIDSSNHFVLHDKDSMGKPPNGGTYCAAPTPSVIGTLLCLLANRYISEKTNLIHFQ